jgi:hypothetical protein
MSEYVFEPSPAATDLVLIVDVSDTTQAASGSTNKVTLENLASSDPFEQRYGRLLDDGYYYGPDHGAATSTLAITVDTMYLVPMWLPAGFTVTRLAVSVTGAGGVGSVVRLGVYESSSTGLPDALLVDGGTIDGTSATVQEVTVSAAVNASGWHWLAAVAQVGTLPTVTSVQPVAGVAPRATTATNALGAIRATPQVTGVTGALPDPVGTLVTSSATVAPLIVIKGTNA